MPDKEQQEKTLSERLVKEAVGKGMDSPMREHILEAVEESEGSESEQKPTLPLVGALVGLGVALGYLAGRQQGELEETPLGAVDEPEIIEDVAETGSDSDAADESEGGLTAEEEAESDASGGRKLSRILLALGTLAGVVLLRRKLKSEEDEWEPIEEFEPAVDADEEDEADEEEADADEEEDDEEESEADESDEGDEDEE